MAALDRVRRSRGAFQAALTRRTPPHRGLLFAALRASRARLATAGTTGRDYQNKCVCGAEEIASRHESGLAWALLNPLFMLSPWLMGKVAMDEAASLFRRARTPQFPAATGRRIAEEMNAAVQLFESSGW